MSNETQARGPFYAEGKYRCEVLEQVLGVAGTGNSQVIIKFKVLSVYQGGQPQDLVNQYNRTYYGTITENNVEYVMNDLNALGLYVTSFGQIDQNRPNFVSIIGNMVDMICAHEAGQNGLRERWRVAYARESKPLEYKPVAASDVSKLDALFGARLKQNEGKAKRAPQPAAVMAGGAGEIDDADVPF
jgi:hypothetical protein